MEREYQDELPIHLVHNHPQNVRDDLGDLTELIASIREVGILEPLVLAPCDGHCDGYVAIAGNRRLAGGKAAGLTVVPAIIRRGMTEQQVYQAMLIENLHRVDLGPMEEARALKGLKESGLTLQAIARKIGKSDAFVHDRIILTELPPELAHKVVMKELTVTKAVQMARLLAGRSLDKVDRGWDTPHFAKSHPLWPLAYSRCRELEHGLRRRIHGACGACWEEVIRADVDGSSAVERAPAPAPTEQEPLDVPDALALLNLFAGCHLNVQTATPQRVRQAIDRATERIRDDLAEWQRQQDRTRPTIGRIQDEAATGRVRHDADELDTAYDDAPEPAVAG